MIISPRTKIAVSTLSTLTQMICGVAIIKVISMKCGLETLSNWYVLGAVFGIVEFSDFAYHRILSRIYAYSSKKELKKTFFYFITACSLIILGVKLSVSFLDIEISVFYVSCYLMSILLTKYLEPFCVSGRLVFEWKIINVIFNSLKIGFLLLISDSILSIIQLLTILNIVYSVTLLIVLIFKFSFVNKVRDDPRDKYKIWISLLANYFLYKSLFFLIEDVDSALVVKVGLALQTVLLLDAFIMNLYSGIQDDVLSLIVSGKEGKLLRLVGRTTLWSLLALSICFSGILLAKENIANLTGLRFDLFTNTELLILYFFTFATILSSLSVSILINLGVVTFQYTSLFQIVTLFILLYLGKGYNIYWLVLFTPWLAQLYNFLFRPYQLFSILKERELRIEEA